MAWIEGTSMQPVGTGWIKNLQDQVQNHPAWNERVSEKEAEVFLQGQLPFTFILRKDIDYHHYFISFVKADHSIKHQKFSIESDSKGWYFRNGTVNKPREVTADHVEDLILAMMQCDSFEAKVLKIDAR